MSKLRLDKSRDYGSILPAGHYRGAFYSQDGHYFDHEGAYLFSDDGVKVGAAPAAPTEPVPAKAATSEVDLRAWALGHVEAPFFKVKKAARLAGYSDEETANGDTIRKTLIRDGVVGEHELAD